MCPVTCWVFILCPDRFLENEDSLVNQAEWKFFCPHGVYMITVEETNDKQANKSPVISETKHCREY